MWHSAMEIDSVMMYMKHVVEMSSESSTGGDKKLWFDWLHVPAVPKC